MMSTANCYQNTCSSENRIDSNLRWVVMRFAVALILLVAAILKAHQLATTPSLGENLLHARWFNILVIEFELFFGIWLIFGLLPRLTWFATVGCFSVFALVSLYKAVSGETSCGCFGEVAVNPWFTMLFDLLVIGILMLFRPPKMVFWRREIFLWFTPNFQYRNIVFVVLTWLIVAIPTSYAMIAINKIDIDELGTEFISIDGKKTILLKPEKWIGKKLPLLSHIEQQKDNIELLKNGQWTIVLFSHDCLKCKQTMGNLIAIKTRNVFCVEIPPYGKNNEQFKDFKYTKLDNGRKWFVDTPVILKTNGLIVEEVSNGLN
jgi:uncharacterized membrane protein YphA (DoxX/SURF4 family)